MNVRVILGDITTIESEAIVNAANNSLLGGGGVDGAIHRIGGKEILNDCIKIRETQGGCDTGKAVITTAGKLPAKYVIHTVGPIWYGGNKKEEELLLDCYYSILEIAFDINIRKISIPNISTGVYGFPKELAGDIAKQWIDNNRDKDIEVIFVCFDRENYNIYKKLFATV